MGRIQLLDCTLRDGGLCLEDAVKNGIKIKEFDSHERRMVAELLSEAKIDIIELGSIEINESEKKGFAIYQDIEDVSAQMLQKKKEGQMFAALYRGPDTPIEDIPNWNPSLCEVIRVIIRYSELKKSLDFCKALAKKGYKVFVQPMLTMRYTLDEIQQLINAANEMNAYALYFVDSYGYMMEKDVQTLFKLFDRGLNASVKIGFHAHNNMNLAFANALTFLKISGERDIIIDSCVLGMGQGAGNLQTEIIVDYLNSECCAEYDFGAVLETCELIEKHNENKLWGYSAERFISATRRTAYKYAVTLRNKYGLTYKGMDRLLASIPEELRHRYTPENVEKLLETNGKQERGNQ